MEQSKHSMWVPLLLDMRRLRKTQKEQGDLTEKMGSTLKMSIVTSSGHQKIDRCGECVPSEQL